METILVSACLLGEKCKYDGRSNYRPFVEKLKKQFDIVPVCPEVLGGLKIPREKSEIKKSKDMVVSETGRDVTRAFNKGRDEELNIVKYLHITKAVLMERSPSCGVHKVYNGQFNGTLIDGEGVTTKGLRELGVQVFTIEEMEEYLDELKNSN